MKYLIILCFFMLMCSCSTYHRAGITMLNEEITKTQYRSFPEYLSTKKEREKNFRKRGGYFCVNCILFERFRLYRYHSNFFNEIKTNDTIYIIDGLGFPSNNYYLIIWNRIDTASFYANSTEMKLSKASNIVEERSFSKCEIQLVGEWNIKGIREEEKKYSNINGGGIRYATRVIVKKRKYQIDCIRYEEFWLPERDRWDDIPVEFQPENIPKCGEWNNDRNSNKRKK